MENKPITNKRAVMISIRPKWVERILSDSNPLFLQKTYEIRKTKPELDPPFTCYIYCTSRRPEIWLSGVKDGRENYRLNGKVVAQFTCDKIWTIEQFVDSHWQMRYSEQTDDQREYISTINIFNNLVICSQIGMTESQLSEYLSEAGYAWHISDLKIFDKPAEVSDFSYVYCIDRLKKPPQSWCYVNEKEGIG